VASAVRVIDDTAVTLVLELVTVTLNPPPSPPPPEEHAMMPTNIKVNNTPSFINLLIDLLFLRTKYCFADVGSKP
jgi:hypothetical protein